MATFTERTPVPEEEPDEEDCLPAYGEQGSSLNPDIHIKWICDGLETLSDVAETLRDYALICELSEKDGWQLSEAVDNSHGFVYWAKEGPPPEFVENV